MKIWDENIEWVEIVAENEVGGILITW